MTTFNVEDRQRYEPKNVNAEHQSKLKFQDRIAVSITAAVGTMYAVYGFVLFTAGWMLWQSKFSTKPFDPYPFALLLFIGNIVQLLLMPLIMVGQNVQARHSEIRADEEYRATTTSFRDIEQIMRHLKAQDEELLNQRKLIEELLTKR